MLDQFEEILKKDITKAQLLLKQIRALLDVKNKPTFNGPISITPDVRVIISIREDDLYLLEELIDNNYIQDLKANRYRLTALSIENAEEIINLGDDFFDKTQRDNIRSRIIEETTENKEINTILLSLYCYLLWHHAYDNAGDTPVKISYDDVLLLNGRKNLIADFYEKVVEKLSKEQRRKFEERLVSEGGRRLSDNIDDFQKALWGNVLEETGDQYDKYKLLVAGEYAILREFKGKTKIELIHDRIAGVIAEKVSHRMKREQNLNRLISMRNVLLPQGRALLDNSLDFGEDRTYYDTRYPWDYFVHLVDRLYDKKDHINVFQESSAPTPFADEALSNSDITLSFDSNDGNICTRDGIYKLRLTYTNDKVTKVVFLDKNSESLYIRGGYAGIEIKYDANNNYEIERKYIDKYGYPIKNKDGYAFVTFEYEDKYGEEGFPTKTLYYDENRKPCPHIFGNIGFKSAYDEDGFEYKRTFLSGDTESCPTICNVYGKEIEYDEDSLLITSIKNLNSEGEIHPDKDGYIQIRYEYDEEKQRIVRETFCDGNGTPMNGDEGYATMKMTYAQDKSYEEQTYLDAEGKPILYHGASKVFVPLDKFGRYLGLEFRDDNNQLVKEEENIYFMRWTLDDQERIISTTYRTYSNETDRTEHNWFHYDESGKHIIEKGYKDDYGVAKKEEDNESYGERIINADSQEIPMHVLLNQYGNPYKCNQGWSAYKTWTDANEDEIRMYYDANGNQIANNENVYGHRWSIKERLIIQTSLGKDGAPVEDQDGVCYIETSIDNQFKYLYNINHEPAADSDGFHGYKIEQKGNRLVKSIFNIHQEIIQYEIEEDERVNDTTIHREWEEDANHQPIGTLKETITNISCDGIKQVIEKVQNEEGQIIFNETHYNAQDYPIYRRSFKEDNTPLQENNGSFGVRYEYYRKDLPSKIYLLDADGNEYECIERTYDEQNRVIKEVRRNADGDLLMDEVGDYGTAYEYSTIDNVSVRVTISLGKESLPQMNNAGYTYKYDETNSDGKICHIRFLDENKNPIMLPDGTFGYKYYYEQNVKIESNVDQDGNLCFNKYGYAYKRIIEIDGDFQEMYFDINGQPTISTEDGCEDYGKIKSCDGSLIISVDKEGNPCINKYGYAIKTTTEDVDGDGVRILLEKYLDLDKNPTIVIDDRNLGNYGLKILISKDDDGDEVRYFIGLDRDGNNRLNNKGYLAERRVYDKYGRIIHYIYLDNNFKPMKDELDDYGTAIQYSDDGTSSRVWSLDKNMQKHNNWQGWAYMDQLTLITGEKIRLYWDLSGNQVIPKSNQSFFSRIFG